MAEVTYRNGEPTMVDYTPSGGNVAEGTVVLLGTVTANTAGTGAVAAVAHVAITNNTLGAVSVGDGVYEGVNLNNAAVGTKVYWEDTNNKFTTVSTNNAVFGFVVSNGAGGTNSTCRVLHKPYYAAN
jgi:hypothetical protein